MHAKRTGTHDNVLYQRRRATRLYGLTLPRP
jgi:hypothetical protein